MSPASASAMPTAVPAQLTLVIPTYNEAENINPLLDRVSKVLTGLDWEIIFVDDDSSDATREHIYQRAADDKRIRCIHRIGRKGLSTACLEGILASTAPVVGVMDGDLQHDEAILPQMYEAVNRQGFDLAIGSRYIAGGGVGRWGNRRRRISRWATRLSQALTRVDVSDPMSGFFMFRRTELIGAIRQTSGFGFKLLLDLLLSAKRPLRIIEIPYQFRVRRAGVSKLSPGVAWQFVLLILDKKIGRFVPVRFLSFSAVGAIGVLVHFLTLWLVYQVMGGSFTIAQSVATLFAMTSNFLINNISTFADRSLSGLALLRGWLSFVAACSIGALANVGIAGTLFSHDIDWALSALAGVLISAVWNYSVTALYTWRKH